MSEKRKAKRTELSSRLVIKSLNENESSDVAIEILNVSKTGVGFFCNEKLEIGAVYEGFMTIWTKEVIHCFIEIVRIEKKDDGIFEYGGIFIGMPDMEAQRIEVYQVFNDN